MRMKYEDPRMEEYYASLPARVRSFLDRSGAEIASLGELMLIGEHFRNSLGPAGEEDGKGEPQR